MEGVWKEEKVERLGDVEGVSIELEVKTSDLEANLVAMVIKNCFAEFICS